MQQTTIWQVYTTSVNVCCCCICIDVVGKMLFTISAVRCSFVDCLVIALNVNGRICCDMKAMVHSLSDSLFWSSCILTSRNNYCLVTHREKNTRRMYSTLLRRISLELERVFDFWWKRNLLGRVLAAVNLFSYLAHTGALMRWSPVKLTFQIYSYIYRVSLSLFLCIIPWTCRPKINLFLYAPPRSCFLFISGGSMFLSRVSNWFQLAFLLTVQREIEGASAIHTSHSYLHILFH